MGFINQLLAAVMYCLALGIVFLVAYFVQFICAIIIAVRKDFPNWFKLFPIISSVGLVVLAYVAIRRPDHERLQVVVFCFLSAIHLAVFAVGVTAFGGKRRLLVILGLGPMLAILLPSTYLVFRDFRAKKAESSVDYRVMPVCVAKSGSRFSCRSTERAICPVYEVG